MRMEINPIKLLKNLWRKLDRELLIRLVLLLILLHLIIGFLSYFLGCLESKSKYSIPKYKIAPQYRIK